jgi:hypothetical protein
MDALPRPGADLPSLVKPMGGSAMAARTVPIFIAGAKID